MLKIDKDGKQYVGDPVSDQWTPLNVGFMGWLSTALAKAVLREEVQYRTIGRGNVILVELQDGRLMPATDADVILYRGDKPSEVVSVEAFAARRIEVPTR